MSIANAMKQWMTVRRIRNALKRDPYNIESLLKLAGMLGADRNEKRKLLHRILYLEPGNRQARALLFELDRAEIGGDLSRLSQAIILTGPSSNDLPEPPLVLRYSFVHQILVYLFIGCTMIAGLIIVREPLVLAAVAAFLLIPLWFVSAIIEIGESGLEVSRLFGMARSEIRWREVKEVKPTILGHGIRIISRKGKALEVSAHIHGYPFILDILRQTRPDLFDISESSAMGEIPQSEPAVTSVGAKIFK